MTEEALNWTPDFVRQQHLERLLTMTVICQVTICELPMLTMLAYISKSTVNYTYIHTAQLLAYSHYPSRPICQWWNQDSKLLTSTARCPFGWCRIGEISVWLTKGSRDILTSSIDIIQLVVLAVVVPLQMTEYSYTSLLLSDNIQQFSPSQFHTIKLCTKWVKTCADWATYRLLSSAFS